MVTKGFIHVYTGNGKGKTTAALGLAIRALGAGKSVYIGQFVKSMKYSEIIILDNLTNIVVEQFGLGCSISRAFTQVDIDMANEGLKTVNDIIVHNKYDVVILDEICIALFYKLININDLLKILKEKPESMEIILTGRYAPSELLNIADLVTEMKEVKHYYSKGILSRKGIDC